MRFVCVTVITVALACAAWAQDTPACACGKNPPGPPAPRSLKPYSGAPEDQEVLSEQVRFIKARLGITPGA